MNLKVEIPIDPSYVCKDINMNRQDKWQGGKLISRGIEWTQVYGRPGYTWNPTAGCLHGCTWRMPDGSVTECYAKTIAEGLARQVYPDGFEHHYWRPHLIEEPLNLSEPSGIFVGSMADLFGHWVPDKQIHQVLDTMQRARWHIFLTLSKYPVRLKDYEFPSNVWVGLSLPAGHLMSATGAARAFEVFIHHMQQIEASTRFMSLEPLWFDVAPILEGWLSSNARLPFEWVILGAASNGPRVYQPESHWVQRALDILDDQNIPIFFKGNLHGNPAVSVWREEFPEETAHENYGSDKMLPELRRPVEGFGG